MTEAGVDAGNASRAEEETTTGIEAGTKTAGLEVETESLITETVLETDISADSRENVDSGTGFRLRADTDSVDTFAFKHLKQTQSKYRLQYDLRKIRWCKFFTSNEQRFHCYLIHGVRQ